MKTRGSLALLAAALILGYASDAAIRRSGGASCAALPPVRVASAKAAPRNLAPRKAARPAPKAQGKLVVYYFHGNLRCNSCRQIEGLTNAAIQESFPNELKSGRLEWRLVNVDAKGNDHYMKDYRLYTRSVVLSDRKGGKEVRWKNLEKVWNLLGDPIAFKGYIRSEVSACLKGA